MTKVIGVRFRQAGKIYFFSPGKLEIKPQDRVIVETARGVEFGKVVTGPKEVEDDKITQPLKSVTSFSSIGLLSYFIPFSHLVHDYIMSKHCFKLSS